MSRRACGNFNYGIGYAYSAVFGNDNAGCARAVRYSYYRAQIVGIFYSVKDNEEHFFALFFAFFYYFVQVVIGVLGGNRYYALVSTGRRKFF